MEFEVVIAGAANVDLVTRAPRLPYLGEAVFSSELTILPGGKGLNQAIAAARRGGQVALIAKAGDDPWGQMLRDTLLASGVDTQAFTLIPDARTGAAFIVVTPDGENTMIVAAGTQTRHSLQDVQAQADLITSTSVNVIQLELDPAIISYIAMTANHAGQRVIGTLAPIKPLPSKILGLLDPLVVNSREASILLGAPVDALPEPTSVAQGLTRLGARSAVVTLGAIGVAYASDEGVSFRPAPAVDVVDTTGAGDAFVGTLASALAFGATIPEAVEVGIHVAALVVQQLGAQPCDDLPYMGRQTLRKGEGDWTHR